MSCRGERLARMLHDEHILDGAARLAYRALGKETVMGESGERWVDTDLMITALKEAIWGVENGTLDLATARDLEVQEQLIYRTAELAIEASREGMDEILPEIDVHLDEEDLARWRGCLKQFGEAIKRKMNRSFGPS